MVTLIQWCIRRRLWAAGGLALTCSTPACGNSESPDPPSPTHPALQPLVSAMCDTDAFDEVARGFVERGDTLRLVSALDLLEKEVHDCQALIMGDTLGPRVSLLVSTDRVAAEDFGDGMVVAEIINHSAQAYEHGRLRIAPMAVSCLWVRGGDATEWVAAILLPPGDETCPTAEFDPPAEVLLPVNRRMHNDTTYPSTGRWMWDPAMRAQFIGIRCGYAWCETGPPGFTGTPSLPDVASVPGWYDEQLLSYIPPGMDRLQLSGLLGRIAPVPDLSDIPGFAYAHTAGVHVANLTFTATGPQGGADEARAYYESRFKLDPTARVHRLFLRVVGSDSGERWEMRTGPLSQWTPVHRRVDHAHSGRGTVRWAWIETDEGGWVPCDLGCCMVHELS